MRTKVKILQSKVIQLDGWNILCEDGSIWQMSDTNQQVEWTQLHPPYEPPRQSGNVAAIYHDRQLTGDEIYLVRSTID